MPAWLFTCCAAAGKNFLYIKISCYNAVRFEKFYGKKGNAGDLLNVIWIFAQQPAVALINLIVQILKTENFQSQHFKILFIHPENFCAKLMARHHSKIGKKCSN